MAQDGEEAGLEGVGEEEREGPAMEGDGGGRGDFVAWFWLGWTLVPFLSRVPYRPRTCAVHSLWYLRMLEFSFLHLS